MMLSSPFQMGSGGMMPGWFDWGSMWLFMVLPAVAVGAALVIVVFLILHYDRTRVPTITPGYSPLTPVAGSDQRPPDNPGQPKDTALGEVFRSLEPTLMDDEKRVMGEMVRAGGEVLQSDLPRMTDFSKATVSKAIHGLEVRGIVLRERHKWTYWCKVNPRLVDRIGQPEQGEPQTALS